MRRPIPVEKRLAITLWRLATPCVYRTTAEQFGVGCSTAAQIVLEVCFAMEMTLLARTVKIGNVAEIMHVFGELGFPHCVGAVDGSHIPIQSPIHQASENINRKDDYSMILQGTCDHKGRFINVEIGWSGKNHDAYVFANSGLCETMDAGVFVPTHPTIRLASACPPPGCVPGGACDGAAVAVTPDLVRSFSRLEGTVRRTRFPEDSAGDILLLDDIMKATKKLL
ncbi:uncharacterized protein LOC134397858 [Elgaria multicarinata webbii]|uniref:uncharacterized protein LOC134397858 n=1 Tax=Elgaria multicarinata webbii TaxID=159646 RepID=UPI002FCD58D0